jgi:hypothetical protein
MYSYYREGKEIGMDRSSKKEYKPGEKQLIFNSRMV